MGKSKTIASSSQKPAKTPTKKLGVTKPPISKQVKAKEKKSNVKEILYIRNDASGRHIGWTSLDPTRHVLAPVSVSRADGDMQRESPPVSPTRDRENIFAREKPYDFNAPFEFANKKSELMHENLISSGKEFIPSLYPCIDALSTLEILDEFKEMVNKSGLSFVFRPNPGSFSRLSLEFLSSFDPVVKVNDKGNEEVKLWKFTMGGYHWEITPNVLRDWFRFPYGGLFPRVNDERVSAFWKRLTGKTYEEDKYHYSSSIKPPMWKLVRKLLGGFIFVRSNYGRTVNKQEMQVMRMMDREQEIDWLWCITRGLKENQETSRKNLGMGGGSIITHIALRLNFTFEGGECDKLELTIDEMKGRKMLGKDLLWKNSMEVVSGDESGDGDSDDDDDDEQPPQPDVRDIPSSSHVPPTTPTKTTTKPTPKQRASDPKLDIILSTLQTLAKYVSDHNTWEEESIRTIAEELNISHKIREPPRSPFVPRSPSPPLFPRSKHGKEKVGEEPSREYVDRENFDEEELRRVVDMATGGSQGGSDGVDVGSFFVSSNEEVAVQVEPVEEESEVGLMGAHDLTIVPYTFPPFGIPPPTITSLDPPTPDEHMEEDVQSPASD